jgi:hypothetical protein
LSAVECGDAGASASATRIAERSAVSWLSTSMQCEPVGERQSEPASFTPAANPEAATTAAVEVPPPPAPRKWSWPDPMWHTFAVDAL